MRKIIVVLSILVGSALLIAVSAQRDSLHSANLASQADSLMNATREAEVASREARRNERQAIFQRELDSLILTKCYQFNVSQMEIPATGLTQLIQNPNFILSIWDDEAEIYLPYVRSHMPPYQSDILNFTVPIAGTYEAEMSPEGWIIKFSSPLRSASNYVFTLEISTKLGGATLIITNPWYREIQYSGTITPLY